MKHRRYQELLWAVVMVAGISLLGGCASTELQQPVTEDIGLSGGSQSECKAFGGSEQGADQVAGSVAIETHHTWASVIHENVVYNCAADITFDLEVRGSTLIITENDINTMPADCVCPFDVRVKVMNLVEGATYRLMLYNEDHSILFADKTFRMEECENQCVTPDDCEALDIDQPACEGQWTCNEGQCGWECNSLIECGSDGECPYGYVCMYAQPSDDGSTDPDDSGTAVGYTGVCEQVEIACTADWDCYDLLYDENGYARPDCMGEWACVNGLCEYQCQETQCSQNADCAEGMECVFYDFIDYGFCEYVRTDDCWSDVDCAEGFHCEYMTTDPVYDCDDASDPDCVPPEPIGVCIRDDNPGECYSDDECMAGQHCEFYWNGDTCMDEAGAAVPCEPVGQCVWDRPVIECFEDAQCPEGQVCSFDDYEFADGMPEERCGIDETGEIMCFTTGICMPERPRDECLSSADCPQGYQCIMTAVDCAGDPSVDCYPYETGMCVPEDNPEYCYDDAECTAGFHCNFDWDTVDEDGTHYNDCFDEATGLMRPCMPPPGLCVPDEEPPYPGECQVDSDCPAGLVCEMMAVDCFDETGGTDCYPYEIGVCVQPDEPPAECVADSDCPAGYFCAADSGLCVPREEPPVQCQDDSQCGYGAVCMDGLCIVLPDNPCAVDIDCAAGMVCMDGLCVEDSQPDPGNPCAADVDCAAGMVCMDGLCVENPQPDPLECRTDADCPADLMCVFVNWCGVGACVAPGQEVPQTYCR